MDHNPWIIHIHGRTQDIDILVALASITTLMNEAGLQDYHAGMWKTYLPDALNWKPKRDDGDTRRRPTSYTAPLWSWASVIGPIEWYHSNTWTFNTLKRYCPQIMGFSLTLTCDGPFGGLSAVTLRVRAPLAHAMIYSNHEDGVPIPDPRSMDFPTLITKIFSLTCGNLVPSHLPVLASTSYKRKRYPMSTMINEVNPKP